jgi:hypothetical protein
MEEYRMSLPKVNLDDRSFDQLIKEAEDRIIKTCPSWTDFSPGDPGRIMVELFAYLTETMIYRINRLPEKVYVELLRLIGVDLLSPRAACARVVFSLKNPQNKDVEIPRGTRIASSVPSRNGQVPVFTLLETVTIKAGETTVEAKLYNGELIEAERPSRNGSEMRCKVLRTPIIANLNDMDYGKTIIVGVEMVDGDNVSRDEFEVFGGKKYRLWKEVKSFPDSNNYPFVFVADRLKGIISLYPVTTIPPERDIRIWYLFGGGAQGNVQEHTLTVLKDQIGKASITVDNPEPAAGGMDAETLEKALVRGPKEFRSLERAVTAEDFELVALENPSIGRAKAYTKRAIWEYARPGTVELLLVPSVPSELWIQNRLTSEMLVKNQTKEILDQVKSEVDLRRPLGTECSVGWVKYKEVTVKARVVVNHGEDIPIIRERIVKRLNLSISPLSTEIQPSGWQFSNPLRISQVYKILLDEPGVCYANNVVLSIGDVIDNVVSVAADPHQKQTWYATTKDFVFRTSNDTEGWELIGHFENENITLIKVHPTRPGIIALCSTNISTEEYLIHFSTDSGETWESTSIFKFQIEDMVWCDRDDHPLLYLASDEGLFEVWITQFPVPKNLVPTKVVVNQQDANQGYYAVTAAIDLQGITYIAVAAQKSGGVFLSSFGGKDFKNIGQVNKDIRTLAIQIDDADLILWAGVTVPGSEKGVGAVRWKLRGTNTSMDGEIFSKNWVGGSCMSLAFYRDFIYAGTFNAGILSLDTSKSDNPWTGGLSDINCGLPIREVGRFFYPVVTIAARPIPNQSTLANDFFCLAGGEKGLYHGGMTMEKTQWFKNCAQSEFTDKVTIPNGWLFCSGNHTIEVLYI